MQTISRHFNDKTVDKPDAYKGFSRRPRSPNAAQSPQGATPTKSASAVAQERLFGSPTADQPPAYPVCGGRRAGGRSPSVESAASSDAGNSAVRGRRHVMQYVPSVTPRGKKQAVKAPTDTTSPSANGSGSKSEPIILSNGCVAPAGKGVKPEHPNKSSCLFNSVARDDASPNKFALRESAKVCAMSRYQHTGKINQPSEYKDMPVKQQRFKGSVQSGKEPSLTGILRPLPTNPSQPLKPLVAPFATS